MSKILVVEDDPETRAMLVEALSEEGFEVISAENGRVGLQKTREHLPDLIICDLIMPELNGDLVLADIRQNPETSEIPFIFLTAKTDELQRERGMQLGANDYLNKPCTIEKLLVAIARSLVKDARPKQVNE